MRAEIPTEVPFFMFLMIFFVVLCCLLLFMFAGIARARANEELPMKNPPTGIRSAYFNAVAGVIILIAGMLIIFRLGVSTGTGTPRKFEEMNLGNVYKVVGKMQEGKNFVFAAKDPKKPKGRITLFIAKEEPPSMLVKTEFVGEIKLIPASSPQED